MSERFSKLSSLPENLYATGSPVIISAGNLLKDNQTNKVLAQLKIKNITDKTIKATAVLIHLQDTAGKDLESDVLQQYLDLSIDCGEEFGQKNAIFLPDNSARGFSVEVKQVVFSDNSIWEETGTVWNPLPAPKNLSQHLEDSELVKQFQLEFGGECKAVPQEHKDLWLCTCGAWNRDKKCYACGKGKEALFSLDLDTLKAERDARLAKEKAEREVKEAAEKALAEAKAKKTKKTLAILIPSVVIGIALFLLVTKVIIPHAEYKKAIALLNSEQYEDAIVAFSLLNGYQESESYIQQARDEIEKANLYSAALALMETGDADGYKKAKKQFEDLGNYKNSQELAEQCGAVLNDKDFQNYTKALELMKNGEYKKAIDLFDKCAFYSDSAQKKQECLDALFAESIGLLDENKYRAAFTSFQYFVSNGYRVAEAEEYMKECNQSYVSMIRDGKWIEVPYDYPLRSSENHIKISSFKIRYINNRIEFSIDYSITKVENYTDAYVECWGSQSPYFVHKDININDSSASIAVDYDTIIQGFLDKKYTVVLVGINYHIKNLHNSQNHRFYDSQVFDFYLVDLQKRDLYGRVI